MTTQYSPILKLALPVQGELSGTWGDVVNDNITSMVEQAIAGRAVINTWSTNSHTLTSANGTTSESRCAMLELTDTGTALSGAGTVICPALSKIYIVKNAAGQNITVKTASGTGILVPNGRTTFLFCDGTNVVEALTHTTSLQLGTSTTVTAVLDEDNMASDSATSLATQQSIKAYVDSKVGQFDSLAEVLAVGNTTGSNDIIVDNGQKITTNTIDETTAGSGVTIDSVLLKDDVVNATDVETGSISANDGTTAATIANSTGVVTVPSAVLTTADINGGTADGVVIGGTTPAAATVTTATANTSLNIAGTVTVTSVLDEDNMASDDPAGLATQQSIKAYVDAQVGANNELSEVLANGNTTGGNDIVFSAGDNITNVSGNFAIDVDGDIELNADGSTIVLKDNTLARFTFNLDSTPSLQVGGTSLEIETTTDNSDILFKGSDGGSAITALTLDMSEAGAATFNSGVTLSGDLTVDTDTLYVDSTNDRVTINSSGSNASGDLIVGNTTGGVFTLTRVSEDIAQNNLLGRIDWFNDDNSGEGQNIAAQIGAYAATSLGEDAYLQFHTKAATAGGGTAGNTLTLLSDGTVNVANGGSESAPILVLQGDTDTGQWRPDANTIAWSTQGNEVLRFDSSQRVLMGTNPSSIAIGSTAQAIMQVHQNATTVSASFGSFANNVGGPVISLGHSRNTTVGTAGAIVSSGDSLGTFRWAGDDGTDMVTQSAKINVSVDGTPGSNDMPGRLQFYTTADGASSSTERMRIDSAGNVEIGGSGSIFTSSFNETVLAVTSASSNTNAAIEIRSNTGAANTYSSAIHFINEAAGASGHQKRIAQIQVETSGDIDSGELSFLTNSDVTAGGPQEAMRIDSGQRVLIGTTSSVDTAGISARLQMVGTNSSTSSSTFTRFSANNGAPSMRFGKSRSASSSSNTIVQDNDYIGTVNFVADDGTDLYSTAAFISGQVDGTPGSNDMPGRLAFFTTPDGASGSTERMRISQNGFVNIGGQKTADESLVELNKSGSNTVGEGHIGFAGGSDPLWAFRFDNSDFNFSFDRSYGGWASTPAMSIRRMNGYVGLGVSVASYQLDVQNSANTFSRILATGNSTRAGYLAQAHLSDGTDINMNVGVYGDANQGEISMATGHPLLLYTNNDPAKGVEIQVDGDLNIKDGNLVVANGHGIDFSATGNGSGTTTSELLDDYEEGTWTPTYSTSGGGQSQTYTNQIGIYTKIGDLVTIHFNLDIASSTNIGSGDVVITGLPFASGSTSATSNYNRTPFSTYNVDYDTATGQVMQFYIPTSNQTKLGILFSRDNSSWFVGTTSNFNIGTNRTIIVMGSLSYYTDA